MLICCHSATRWRPATAVIVRLERCAANFSPFRVTSGCTQLKLDLTQLRKCKEHTSVWYIHSKIANRSCAIWLEANYANNVEGAIRCSKHETNLASEGWMWILRSIDFHQLPSVSIGLHRFPSAFKTFKLYTSRYLAWWVFSPKRVIFKARFEYFDPHYVLGDLPKRWWLKIVLNNHGNMSFLFCFVLNLLFCFTVSLWASWARYNDKVVQIVYVNVLYFHRRPSSHLNKSRINYRYITSYGCAHCDSLYFETETGHYWLPVTDLSKTCLRKQCPRRKSVLYVMHYFRNMVRLARTPSQASEADSYRVF